ncbi:MAG: VOC family protein [bacterium]
MMIRRIDHVAIAVRNLERAKAFFIGALGGRELFSCPHPFQHYSWTLIELGSSCCIELIASLDDQSFVRRFLDKRGEGPHHVTIQVPDIQAAHRRLEECGVPTFDYSESLPGWKEFFVHPKNAFGTLLQFAEFNPLDWVNPGYVPACYREFAPAGEARDRPEAVEVRHVVSREGPAIEIRHGTEKLTIPQGRLGELVATLQRLL